MFALMWLEFRQRLRRLPGRRLLARLGWRRREARWGVAGLALAGLVAGYVWLLMADRWHEEEASPIDAAAFASLPANERCLAQAIYFEARGEPLEGRMAVAQVVLNRTRDARYPGDVCAVVFQYQHRRHRCQFSFACDGRSDRPKDRHAWESALRLARTLAAGGYRDLTKGATHYHALYVSPVWSKALAPTRTIGGHRFYREP